MTKTMTNDYGHTVTVKEGYSWTTLLFGVFVPLSRGDIKWFAIMLITCFFTGGIAWLFFPFFYNKCYINDLRKKGYR